MLTTSGLCDQGPVRLCGLDPTTLESGVSCLLWYGWVSITIAIWISVFRFVAVRNLTRSVFDLRNRQLQHRVLHFSFQYFLGLTPFVVSASDKNGRRKRNRFRRSASPYMRRILSTTQDSSSGQRRDRPVMRASAGQPDTISERTFPNVGSGKQTGK